MSPSAIPAEHRVEAWNRSLAAHPGELDLHVPASAIDGAVPTALRGGRLLSNGPGWNVIGGVTLHPFDGHGYVRAFRLEPDGSVRLTARFVRTPSYLAEAAAGRLVDRGLATNLPGSVWRNIRRGRVRNVANTTITRRGDRLLAGWEGGAPYALDARTLETRGEETFGGALEGQATLAHTKREARTGRLVTFGLENGPTLRFTIRELDRDDRLWATHRAQAPGPAFVHDFAITPGWVVVGANPLRMRPAGIAGWLLGTSTLLSSLETDTRAPGALHLVSRSSGATRTVTLPGAGWIVHFGNAFEREGTVIVDACVLPRFVFGEEFGYAGPSRPFDPTLPERRGKQTLYRITIPAGATDARWGPLAPHGVDFPRFHPDHEGLETPALFGATRADTRYSDPFDSLIRVDLLDRDRPPSLWTVPESTFVGEPVFVPAADRPAAGHVLAIVSRALDDRSELVILDALAIGKGPIAVVPLPLLPVAFHGDWDPRDESAQE